MGLREIQPRFSKPIPPEPPASNPYRETRPSHPQDQGRSRISGGSATCAAGDVPQHRRRRQFRFDHHRLRGSLPGRGFHRGRHWMFPGVPTNALEPHRRSADRTLGWVDHRPLDRVAHLNTNITAEFSRVPGVAVTGARHGHFLRGLAQAMRSGVDRRMRSSQTLSWLRPNHRTWSP